MDKGRRMEKVMKPWVARIKKCDWFANVGAGELEGVSRVGSWKEAKQHLEGDNWDAAGNTALNEFHKSMAPFQGRQLDKWDDGFDDRFDQIDELLEDVMLPVFKKKKIPNPVLDLYRGKVKLSEALVDSFRGKVLGLATELHFFGADHQSFDRQIVEWYLAGHCVCGYEGKYPKGRLVVY